VPLSLFLFVRPFHIACQNNRQNAISVTACPHPALAPAQLSGHSRV
jgi:hypothetical protein